MYIQNATVRFWENAGAPLYAKETPPLYRTEDLNQEIGESLRTQLLDLNPAQFAGLIPASKGNE